VEKPDCESHPHGYEKDYKNRDSLHFNLLFPTRVASGVRRISMGTTINKLMAVEYKIFEPKTKNFIDAMESNTYNHAKNTT
jgi:hypothetical protein